MRGLEWGKREWSEREWGERGEGESGMRREMEVRVGQER